MPQTLLPFQYEVDPTDSKFTALGGLPLFLDLMASLGVIKGLRQYLVGPGDMQGWSVSDVVLALVMVNLAGGECVDDLDRLNADVGFAKVMELAHKSGYSRQQLRALSCLPEGVEKVYLRSDTAGYQVDLLKYCAEGHDERFGVIDFAVGVDVCDEFKKAVGEVDEKDWQPLKKLMEGEWVETGQEWAEVCYVPNWVGHKKHGPVYRFLATREPLRQLELPGVEKKQRQFPFPTMEFGQGDKKTTYKVFGVVTNRNLPGDEVIRWLRKRCGYSEQVHAVMKDDLAGGRMPSGKFGVNAAWWHVMMLALNLSEAMKRLVLGEGWTTKRLKALRFRLIHVGARVVEKGRQIWIRLSRGEAALELLNRAREKIRMLAEAPG